MLDKWQLILRRREALDTLFELYLASVANCDFIGKEQAEQDYTSFESTYKAMMGY